MNAQVHVMYRDGIRYIAVEGAVLTISILFPTPGGQGLLSQVTLFEGAGPAVAFKVCYTGGGA